MVTGTENCKWGDVLMVSAVGAGHVTPLMYVANGLMERGISVTVAIAEDQRATVEKKVDSKHLEAGGLMNFAILPSQSKSDEQSDTGLTGMSTTIKRGCEPLFQNLLAKRKSGVVRKPKCIIADQFLGWTQVWANKLGIPRYVSFPSPAAYALAMLCHDNVEDQVEHALEKDDPDFIVRIPQFPVELHKTDLPGSFLNKHSMMRKEVDKSGDSLKEAAGFLFNTFHEIESAAIDSFQANIEKINAPGKGPRMLPIGPMLPPEFLKEGTFLDKTAKDSKCIQWLDSQPVSSVLYIAFGSWAYLSPHQIQELALALEASQVSFLWVLRVQGTAEVSGSVSELLPPGFCARTQNQGLIYSEFAPQLQILSHPAIGGFLTHCGWNSSLESICRGVPMIGWPKKAEQGLCCRILVDLARVAIEVTKGENELADRHDLENAITYLMKGSQGQELKRRATELQRQALAAVSPGGSSHRNFEQLVTDIRAQP